MFPDFERRFLIKFLWTLDPAVSYSGHNIKVAIVLKAGSHLPEKIFFICFNDIALQKW